jgi:uncharacterized membrane protein YqjE
MSEDSERHASGLVASLHRLLARVAAVAHNRLELLVVELQEERRRVVCVFLMAGALLGLGGMAVVLLTYAVLLAAGAEHRVLAASVLGVAYLLGAVAMGWGLRVRLRTWPPFAATRNELHKDREWLEGRNPEA